MTPFATGRDSIRWTGDGHTLMVQAWGADSVRVRATPHGDLLDHDWALLPPEHAAGGSKVQLEGSVARLTNGRITAELTAYRQMDDQIGYPRFGCRLRILDAQGEALLEEHDSGGALKWRARHFAELDGGSYRLTMSFRAQPGERFYGMGQYQQDVGDLKGSTFELAHRNSQVSVPFVLSSRGYGMLWHNPAVGRATFAANRTEWVAEVTDQLDYWVTAGDTPHQISAAYADATGHAPPMPERGLGFWQCKLRYWNQEQLLQVAREHRLRGLPLDVIVADFFHWPQMGDYRFEDEFWPDPAAMVAELRDMGIELMVSVWPQVSLNSENFEDFAQRGLLVRARRGNDVQMSFEGPSMFIDATNPSAREAVWDLCRRNYHDNGVRHFWLDEAEPEYGAYDFEHYTYHAGSVAKIGNIYPQQFSRAFFDGQRAAGQEDLVNLVRCAWAGSQRYGALVWSGDVASTWQSLRNQISAGIHMGVAGIPWWTMDIGGFHGGRTEDPAFHELLIRWFQVGAFSPVMRLHGDRTPADEVRSSDGSLRRHTGADNEIWSFGPQVEERLTGLLRVRERLRPYLREVMAAAHTNGTPVLRGLFYEFGSDPLTHDLTDQFLLGPDLLVAPVLEPGVRLRTVYLPYGASWTDVATGTVHEGGREVVLDAPLGRIPILARDGREHGLNGMLA